jgi:ribosome-associated protein
MSVKKHFYNERGEKMAAEPEDTGEISKSQRKREANELLDLGKLLINMPDSRLARMPLDDELRREIDFARNIRAHGARKRQMMTVGKKLRLRDVDELLAAVHDLGDKDRKMNARHHHVEAWRDILISGDDKVLTDLLEKAPEVNPQTLRQLIRNARKEASLSKPPASARKLFKMLRDADEENRLPALP